MATKIPVKFKGTKKNSTTDISIEELPNKGDFLDMDGQVWEVTKKTFFYDANGSVTGVEFDLA
ncbi:hypothetical protein IFR08_00870 [Pseudomonas fluorescens]|uniref:hypothetical protein n=1 Tax=Pseudomonas TaxID=286 RepID=UPI0010C11204|nr:MULTISPECIES: hypothetical protein [Pseudomonas]MBD8096181.1 hypothetical protein [Pseudomonas fluorescens]MBD8772328.1 hypothetical protein [Pseudomonas fluorescens]MBD8778850.1 hypothetical protein [Pseudomonas fluorescens]MBD8794901.1 hypothetical protein [Pseudomonas fluorescens]TKK34842.1 hypothetical protein PspCFBP13528_04330 [Pseudomonas sp. CFBP13528]